MFGWAALHIALAIMRAGLPASPIAVIGADLGWMANNPRLAGPDLRRVTVAPSGSCAFRLTCDSSAQLTGTEASFGGAAGLTGHALCALACQYPACG